MITRRGSFLLIGALCAFASDARAQSPTASVTPSPETPSFHLAIGRDGLASLTAKNARVPDIAKTLSVEINVPIHLSSLLAKHTVTVSLDRVPLETLLAALAPQVYVDYEVRWDRQSDDWVAIEMTGYNEKEPRTPIEPRAFMVLAGHTDEAEATGEAIEGKRNRAEEAKLGKDAPSEGPVLDVAVRDGLVSIRARRHMMAAPLLEMASRAGLGFETRGALDEALIDLDIRDTPIDQLPGVIARPGFGVLMRRNLTSGGRRAVAVLLGAQATRVRPRPEASPTPARVQRVR